MTFNTFLAGNFLLSEVNIYPILKCNWLWLLQGELKPIKNLAEKRKKIKIDTALFPLNNPKSLSIFSNN